MDYKYIKEEVTINTMKIFTILIIFIMNLVVKAEEVKPFSCAMPIILEPIMLQLRKTVRPREGELDRRRLFEGKPTKVNFDILSKIPSKEEKDSFDKIIEVSYDNPNSHFIVFIKSNIPVRIEYFDKNRNKYIYKQILTTKLQNINTINKEYSKKSYNLMLKFYQNEFLFMDWGSGKFNAVINASFTSDHFDNSKDNASMEVTFDAPRYECTFNFALGNLYNACYIHSINKKLPYLATYYTFDYDAKENLISGKILEAPAKKAEEILFYDDLGVKMEAIFQGNKYKAITLWKRLGEESKSLTHDEWQTLGMPNDYDEWKKRTTK